VTRLSVIPAKAGIHPVTPYSKKSYNQIMKKIFVLLTLAIFIFLARPAQAVYFGQGDNLSFPKTQKFNETVFLAGTDITIDSDINGDLVCAGQNITINSKITGDVLCAGQNLEINGTVDGNVRSIGQQIDINGNITKNLSTASQNLQLNKSANVKGDIFYGAQNIDLQGIMGRDLAGGSESILISGSLLRNAKIATQKITVADSAKLSGDLEYYIEKTGTSAINEKSVKGKVTRHEVVLQEKEQVKRDIQKVTPALMIFKAVFSILSSVLVAFLLLYFIPIRVIKVSEIIKTHPVKSALLGFAVLVTGPIAMIISCLTVVGISLAAVVALFYVLSLILAGSFVAVRVGEMLAENYPSLKKSVYLSTFLACLLLGLLVHIPVLGAIIGFLVFLIGLGASFLSYLPTDN